MSREELLERGYGFPEEAPTPQQVVAEMIAKTLEQVPEKATPAAE